MSGLFRQRMPGALLYGSLSRKPHSPPLGHWRFCATQPEVGKPSGLFHQSPPEALALWLAAPEIVQSIAGAQWGYERFHTVPPGMGAMP